MADRVAYDEYGRPPMTLAVSPFHPANSSAPALTMVELLARVLTDTRMGRVVAEEGA